MNYAGSLLVVIFLFSTALTGHFWKYLSRVCPIVAAPKHTFCVFIDLKGAAAVVQNGDKLANNWSSNVQEDGKKETAIAATFFLESPWSSEECPQARPVSAKLSSVQACFCNCQSCTPPGNVLRR